MNSTWACWVNGLSPPVIGARGTVEQCLDDKNDDVETKRTRDDKRRGTKYLVQRSDDESNVDTEGKRKGKGKSESDCGRGLC
jgi:hypothetical protein